MQESCASITSVEYSLHHRGIIINMVRIKLTRHATHGARQVSATLKRTVQRVNVAHK